MTKNKSKILQFLNCARFMANSLLTLELNVDSNMMIKKWETCGIKYKYCNCFLQYTNFKINFIKYKCLCCNNNYQNKFAEKLK